MTGRALVLGSGGITGVAWELGLLAGLAARGADLSGAELVVGTSAGSVVAAQLTSGTGLDELYQAQLTPDGIDISATMSRKLMLRYALAFCLPGNSRRVRRRMGKLALASPALSEADRRAVIGGWLPSHQWPSRRLLITAVDVATGEFRAFDGSAGESLVDVVSASCAVPGVWPPVEISGRRWMDGGMRSATNADLAVGCAQVVVLAPIWQGFGALTGAERQLRRLARGSQCRVALVTPSPEASAAIGRNLLDASRRGPAARAGYAQAEAVAAGVAPVWSGGPAAHQPAADTEGRGS